MTILAYIFIPQSQLYQLFALNNVNVGMKLCTTLLCTIRMKTAEGLVVSDPDRIELFLWFKCNAQLLCPKCNAQLQYCIYL